MNLVVELSRFSPAGPGVPISSYSSTGGLLRHEMSALFEAFTFLS